MVDQKKKKSFAESGTRTPTLPFSGNEARNDPVEPPRLDSELKGLITGYIVTLTWVTLPPLPTYLCTFISFISIIHRK